VLHLDPAWIALIGTLCGGIGLKVLEHWLGRSKVKFDESTKLREELRVEVTGLRDEIKTLETEVDKWRKDYYDLRDKFSEVNALYTVALDKIRVAAEAAAKPIDPPSST
jgi:predicted nuclease with TOPRIM domain